MLLDALLSLVLIDAGLIRNRADSRRTMLFP